MGWSARPAIAAKDDDELRAWLQREVAAALVWPTEKILDFSYRVEYHPALNQAELAALQARVGNKPDHPERVTLETQLKRMAAPEISRCRLITDGGSLWRIGNFGESSQAFLDAAVTASSAWTLSRSAVESMASDSVQASTIRSQRDSRRRLIIELASGKLSDVAVYGLQEWRITEATAGWEFAAASPALGAEMLFRIERAEPFRVASVRVTKSPNPEMLGELIEFAGTVALPEGRTMARSMRLFRRGRLAEVTTIDSVAEISRSDLDLAVAIPVQGGDDFVRGPVRISRAVDWRGEVQAIREYGADGKVVAAEIDHAADDRRWRYTGWILCVTAVAAVIVVTRHRISKRLV